jgi:hypothetical protein
MSSISEDLMAFMRKYSGSSGTLILGKEVEKIGIEDLNNMDDDTKELLLNTLTGNWLRTFLDYRRFTVARAELVSILGLSEESYRIQDTRYIRPKSPSMLGKPET